MFCGIIDYAGMFPPAQLPLEQSIHNYARYRNEPESWMLGRFVCPIAQVARLWPHVRALFQADAEIRISALASSANTAAELRAAFASETLARAAVVDSFEMSLSPESLQVFAGGRAPQALPLSDLTTAIEGSDAPLVYYEIPRGPEWSTTLRAVLGSLMESDEHRRGIKLRCGGTTAAAVPTVDDVALAIRSCQSAGLPLKFTAGLHHAIRHYDPTLQAHLHGFLNIFAAGVFCHAHDLSDQQLLPILKEEDASRFVFDAHGLCWGQLCADVAAIEVARRDAVISFGSCSFDEPREDLKALGLIP
jgi:hypothetical protein